MNSISTSCMFFEHNLNQKQQRSARKIDFGKVRPLRTHIWLASMRSKKNKLKRLNDYKHPRCRNEYYRRNPRGNGHATKSKKRPPSPEASLILSSFRFWQISFFLSSSSSSSSFISPGSDFSQLFLLPYKIEHLCLFFSPGHLTFFHYFHIATNYRIKDKEIEGKKDRKKEKEIKKEHGTYKNWIFGSKKHASKRHGFQFA